MVICFCVCVWDFYLLSGLDFVMEESRLQYIWYFVREELLIVKRSVLVAQVQVCYIGVTPRDRKMRVVIWSRCYSSSLIVLLFPALFLVTWLHDHNLLRHDNSLPLPVLLQSKSAAAKSNITAATNTKTHDRLKQRYNTSEPATKRPRKSVCKAVRKTMSMRSWPQRR